MNDYVEELENADDLAINLSFDDKHKAIANKLVPYAMQGDAIALRILADICTDSELSEILKRVAINHGYPTIHQRKHQLIIANN